MNRLISAYFLILILFLSAGCKNKQETPQAPAVQSAPVVPQTLLRQAFEILPENCTYSVYQETQVITESNTFKEVSKQSITYHGFHASNPRIYLSQVLEVGEHAIPGTASYRNGSAFLTVGSGTFRCELSPDIFRQNLTPLTLLNPDFYQKIQADISEDNVTFSLTNPVQAETWSRFADGQLLHAAGTASVGTDGKLLNCTYTLHCLHGGKLIRQQTTVTLSPFCHQISDNIPEYATEIHNPEALWFLERACGHLLSAENLCAELSQTIYDQAYGRTLTHVRTLSLSGTGETFAGQSASTYTLLQTARPSQPEGNSYTLHYSNGILQTEAIGSGTISTQSLTPQDADSLFRDLLLDTLILPEDICGVRVDYDSDTRQYQFLLGEDMAQKICAAAYTALYDNTDPLTEPEQLYRTSDVQAYLTIERSTGLPIASGIAYTGVLDVDGLAYVLSFTAEQAYAYSIAP